MKEDSIEAGKVPSALDNIPILSAATQKGNCNNATEAGDILQEEMLATSDETVSLISKGEDVCFAAKKMECDPAYVKCLQNIESMSPMELRKKYSGEASSHRNMMSRRSTSGAIVHDKLLKFCDFLRCLGPKPIKSATVDRIDNADREYAPGKIRWADKKTQNNNKGDSLLFTCSATGKSYTASLLAEKQSVTPACIRTRRTRGWTDDQVIKGSRKTGTSLPQHQRKVVVNKPQKVSTLARDIMFERNRADCEHARINEGCEHFIITPAELQELLEEDFPAMRGEEWLKQFEAVFLKVKLPLWWASYKPHIKFHALKPFQQALIRQIDPEYRD